VCNYIYTIRGIIKQASCIVLVATQVIRYKYICLIAIVQ